MHTFARQALHSKFTCYYGWVAGSATVAGADAGVASPDLPGKPGGGSNTKINPSTTTKAVMAAPKAPIRAASLLLPCRRWPAEVLRQAKTTATNNTDNSSALSIINLNISYYGNRRLTVHGTGFRQSMPE